MELTPGVIPLKVEPNDISRDFGLVTTFEAKNQKSVARQCGKEMSAQRQIPFLHLARFIIRHNLELNNAVSSLFSPFGTFKCILVRCIFNHCTCAFAETIISKLKASLEVGAGECWHKIDVLTHVNLLSNRNNPFYHLDTDEIPRIFRWGKFRMQWRNDFYLSHVTISTWRLSWLLRSQPIRNYLLIIIIIYSFISNRQLQKTPCVKHPQQKKENDLESLIHSRMRDPNT